MDKLRFVEIDGVEIEVSEEVYRAFKRPAWAERKRRAVRAEHERSLEAFHAAGYDLPDSGKLVEDIVADKMLLDTLYSALSKLTENEREIISSLFYAGMTEREVAGNLEISQQAVHKRKNKILEKLRDLLDF